MRKYIRIEMLKFPYFRGIPTIGSYTKHQNAKVKLKSTNLQHTCKKKFRVCAEVMYIIFENFQAHKHTHTKWCTILVLVSYSVIPRRHPLFTVHMRRVIPPFNQHIYDSASGIFSSVIGSLITLFIMCITCCDPC
jgi:hypothetical protein